MKHWFPSVLLIKTESPILTGMREQLDPISVFLPTTALKTIIIHHLASLDGKIKLHALMKPTLSVPWSSRLLAV